VVGVEMWAEVRRMRRVEGLSARRISERTGLARDTVAKLLAAEVPPKYSRASAGSLLDPLKLWICDQLKQDSTVSSQRLREDAEELGYAGGRTIFDEYVREVRPRFLEARTFQRTVYRPAELVQCDLWEPREHVPVGWGQTRRGYVVTTQSCWSRAFAGTLVFSKEAPDILYGLARNLGRLGLRPLKLVWDRESAIAGRGKPTDAFLAFCGQLEVGW
jgi:transcriptional regulator with XRE-family HTH domain